MMCEFLGGAAPAWKTVSWAADGARVCLNEAV